MKNILLTGVAGFIGSALAENLLERGHKITGIDNLKTGYVSNIPSGVTFIEGDCSDRITYEHPQLCKATYDVIIHMAGQSSGEISFDDPCVDLNDNCVSTLRLLEFARGNNCKKFIFASTMSVYGAVGEGTIDEMHPTVPLSMYAVGKTASESYLRIFRRYDIDSVALRLFNVYGPGQNMSNLRQGMVSIYLAQAIDSGRIEVKGAEDRYRDFVFIDDVVSVVCVFMDREFTGSSIYNVCTGVKTKVSDLITLIKQTIGNEDLPVTFVGSTPGDQFGIVGDNSKLKSFIGDFTFTSLEQGLKKFVSSVGSK